MERAIHLDADRCCLLNGLYKDHNFHKPIFVEIEDFRKVRQNSLTQAKPAPAVIVDSNEPEYFSSEEEDLEEVKELLSAVTIRNQVFTNLLENDVL